MDFMNRNQQNNNRAGGAFRPQAETAAESSKPAPAARAHQAGGSGPDGHWSKWKLWLGYLLVVAVAVLLAAVLWLFIFSRPASESQYVDDSRLQAVFLTNEQVYFGDITRVNDEFLVLTNIYYLQSPQEVSNKSTDGNVSLVKLGCELHRPQDAMVINQSQVTFWENLRDDGQVAKAVEQFAQAHPNGQECSTAQQQNTQTEQTGDQTNDADSQQDSNNTQPSGSNGTNNDADTSNNADDTTTSQQ